MVVRKANTTTQYCEPELRKRRFRPLMNPLSRQRYRRGIIAPPPALVPADLADADPQHWRTALPAQGFKGSGETIPEPGQSR
jgi:hypothetical protein